MSRLRFLLVALMVSLFMACPSVRADDPSDSEKLAKAIELYKADDYEGAAELLDEVVEDDLDNDDERLLLQQYTSMAKKAVARAAEAETDLRDGIAAMEAKDLEKARQLFERVGANQFARKEAKAEAQTHLKEVIEKLGAAQPPAKEQPPPEKPKAEAAQPKPEPQPAALPKTQPQGGASLLSQLAEEHELLWQQAIKTYRDTEAKIRKAVLQENFEEAHQLMDFGKQTLELNRRYATPASAYEDYRNQALELEKFIEDEERDWQEREVQAKATEIAEREKERIDRIQANKLRQTEGLMEQAVELRKERRYDDAIQVLSQVLTIDPENDQAASLKEALEDVAAAIRDRAAVTDRSTQTQSLLIENDESLIPWHDNLRYPKNWPEIIAKRFGAEEAGEPETTRAVRAKLRNVAPEIKFDAMTFEQVIETLRALTGLNIVANWAALEVAGMEKDREVSLRLQNTPYEKALQLILDDIGGGETELAFTIDEGVIQISTKEDLSRKTVVRVYNVQDLIISVPTFTGRELDLGQAQQSQQGGTGGGRFLEGGGGGGQGGQNLFGGGQGQTAEIVPAQGVDPLEPIIELIRATIEPDSWREAGGNVGSIQSLNQQIIVTQTAAAHTQLRDLLKQLRQARSLQVAVEVRYITISRNWLEQIGVDLDVVLNNGNAGFDRTTILDPATNNPVLVPRQFTRLGFTPGAPGGVGITMPTQPFPQPYGQPGLVPATGSIGPHSSQFTPIPLANSTLDLAAPSNTNVPGSLGSLVNSTPAFQVFGSFLDNIQVDFLLRASQVDRRSTDLDAPRLVLFNGQRATFESLIFQDYIAALTPVIGDNAGAFTPQIDNAPTGRSLDVQATVSADRRYVTMTVRSFIVRTGDFRTVFFGGSQTVGSGFVELATQDRQRIRTTVSVPDGGTLLIGGLKMSGERDIDAGVPILSRIPILKRAFSNTSNVKDDQILLILIKPTIIIQEEAEAEQFPTLSASSS